MMPAEQDFDDVGPTESPALSFDFRRLLATDGSETVSSAVFVLTVKTVEQIGVRDTNPSSRLSGGGVVSAATPTIASQVITTGCVPGNQYLLVATATTNIGRQKVMYGHFWCRNPT